MVLFTLLYGCESWTVCRHSVLCLISFISAVYDALLVSSGRTGCPTPTFYALARCQALKRSCCKCSFDGLGMLYACQTTAFQYRYSFVSLHLENVCKVDVFGIVKTLWSWILNSAASAWSYLAVRHSTVQLGALSIVKPSTNSKKRVWQRLNISLQSGRTVLLCALLLEPGHVTDAPRYASQELGFMLTSVLTVNTIVKNDSAIHMHILPHFFGIW